MMKKLRISLFCALLIMLTAILLAGCGSKELVTVTLWHVYGEADDSPLNDLVDEFNETVGKEKNIRVEVSSVTNTNNIHEKVLAAAEGEAGAEALPDMFVSYPKTVLAMPDSSILVNYRDYFSNDEISKFVPEFMQEGMINGKQLVLPVAKSTEILFINKTLFDRFAKATGTQLSDLRTWEGLFKAARKYAQWQDKKTLDQNGDTKPFLAHDSYFDYFQVGVTSLGGSFFNGDGDGISYSPIFDRVWKSYAEAAAEGGVWLGSGYASQAMKTGDAVAVIASSASVRYFSDTVTYADNSSEKISIISLPCPTFIGGEKLAMQRGAGICTVKSTPQREKACVTFLKWLTETERNVQFATSLGYMPVKQDAFSAYLPQAISELTDPMYISMYQAFMQTKAEYKFYTPPQYNDYLAMETEFEDMAREKLQLAAESCKEDPSQSAEALAALSLQSFIRDYEAEK